VRSWQKCLAHVGGIVSRVAQKILLNRLASRQLLGTQVS
jgi:hypothetical protein